MKKLVTITAMAALLAFASPAWAEGPSSPRAQGSAPSCCCPPARFQIFHATGTYGGLIMLDTKTGDSYQRLIVNTPNGIGIKWLNLNRVKKLPANETIVWE
jgi:hypothetical protein